MDRIIFEDDDYAAESEESFSSFLDDFGKKAEANGLTEDVLSKLLNEDLH